MALPRRMGAASSGQADDTAQPPAGGPSDGEVASSVPVGCQDQLVHGFDVIIVNLLLAAAVSQMHDHEPIVRHDVKALSDGAGGVICVTRDLPHVAGRPLNHAIRVAALVPVLPINPHEGDETDEQRPRARTNKCVLR